VADAKRPTLDPPESFALAELAGDHALRRARGVSRSGNAFMDKSRLLHLGAPESRSPQSHRRAALAASSARADSLDWPYGTIGRT